MNAEMGLKCSIILVALLTLVECGDMLRKSIVFDKNTPDVFYCPQHKPTGFDKMLVKAKPLSKLCEFGGNALPEDYKSDCYNDIDESEYACKEKYRIMMRLHPPGGEDTEVHMSEEFMKKFKPKPKKKLIKVVKG